MASCSQVSQGLLQASSWPSEHNFVPVCHQATCSHRSCCCCMFLRIGVTYSKLYVKTNYVSTTSLRFWDTEKSVPTSEEVILLKN